MLSQRSGETISMNKVLAWGDAARNTCRLSDQ
jgi:hypothetical protein